MPRRNIGFNKPPEPSFITRMKQEAGIIEGPNVDTKRTREQNELDDRSSDDDEAPTVVVLREGDLSAEQVQQVKSKHTDKAEETGGRIMFRKPNKREATAETSSETSSSETSNKKHRSEKSKKPKQNTKLLSFHQDDEEED